MQRALFDGRAAEYDAWYETELGRVMAEAESALVLAAFAPPGPEVLEIGCGTGIHTALLAERGYRVTALDASGDMLARARERLASRALEAEWVQGDVREVLPRLGQFHGILTVAALEFMDDPEAVLRESFEHLSAGGCMVVGFIAGESSWSTFYLDRASRHPGSVFAHARFRSPHEVGGWRIGGSGPQLRGGLYFPPTVASAAEARLAERAGLGTPGFIVARWVKT
jgi:ubiquinone/menaquinone biosynthesis C-methylase UbiE